MNRIEAEVEHSAAIYTARRRGEWATLAALRALRRRGAHTKATRRARARAYYRRAGEALR